MRRTLTRDQGKELALHQMITAATGTEVFFCDAHAPWQRASNENMNGLLRDYFPKGTDLSVDTIEDLARVAAEVNERPRQTLGWSRPIDLFDAVLKLRTSPLVADVRLTAAEQGFSLVNGRYPIAVIPLGQVLDGACRAP